MLSVDLTSSGLGAGTWVEGSWGGLTAACCRAACGAVEVCAAEVKLKSESTAAKVRSLNLMEHPPFAGWNSETIYQQGKKAIRIIRTSPRLLAMRQGPSVGSGRRARRGERGRR